MKITRAFLESLSKALNNEPSLREATLKHAEQLALFLLRLEQDDQKRERERKKREWER